MTKPKTLTDEHTAANKLTRTSVPAPVGALEAMAVAAENEAAFDHDKVVAATAKVSSFRPADTFSDSEATTEGRVATKYATLETIATSIASAARATIAALQNAARVQAATPTLTRK